MNTAFKNIAISSLIALTNGCSSESTHEGAIPKANLRVTIDQVYWDVTVESLDDHPWVVLASLTLRNELEPSRSYFSGSFSATDSPLVLDVDASTITAVFQSRPEVEWAPSEQQATLGPDEIVTLPIGQALGTDYRFEIVLSIFELTADEVRNLD